MVKSSRFSLSSFAALNIAQFLAALNDNLYKLLLIFFLIAKEGPEHSNTILSVAGAVFVIPFILFAALSGTLADRFSKRSIIYFTRLLEILATSLGVLAFFLHSGMGAYAVLFLMATQSSLFSPCKYGIIPEIVSKDKIAHSNGLMTASTYLAIIFGTFLASFITQVTDKNFVLAGSLCILVAIIGTLVSTKIEPTFPQASKKKVSVRFVSQIIKTLKLASRSRYLFVTIVFSAYFLFIGAYTQLNIIPFALQSLHLTAVQGGYLFLMTAIGIGLGAFLAGLFSGKSVELGFVPIASVGVMLCFITLFAFDSYFYVVIPALVILGFFGGFYIVPLDTFIQMASANKDRGQNVAAGNFLSFIGVIFASFLIAFLGNGLDMSAAQGFLVVGCITALTGLILLLLFADQVLRLIAARLAQLFWSIKVLKKEEVKIKGAMLLVAPRRSWVDTLIIMAILPRFIRYIVPTERAHYHLRFFYRLLWLIPIDITHFSPIGEKAIAEIKKELDRGQPVCLMQPVGIEPKRIEEWESHLQELLHKVRVPLVPLHIERELPPSSASRWHEFKSLFRHSVRIHYGKEIS